MLIGPERMELLVIKPYGLSWAVTRREWVEAQVTASMATAWDDPKRKERRGRRRDE